MNSDKSNKRPRKSWRVRFKEYSNLCLTSGFIPTLYPRLERIGKLFSRFWTFLQVGKVTIEGVENLNADGRLIYAFNHSSMLDAVVMYGIMPKGLRYMTAVEEMRGLGGLKAVVMGGMGCFPVDRTNGRTVIPPAIDLLVAGTKIGMYPEGKISPTGQLLEFKKGAAWIAIGTCDRLQHKELVGIVPVLMCYNKRHVPSALNYLKMLWHWRAGITITFGEPVYVHTVVPQTAAALIDRIKLDIVSQSCPTVSVGDPGSENKDGNKQ